MNMIKQKFALASALFIALWTTQTASAWYDPSTGRWLTRDPIGEPGFQALQRIRPVVARTIVNRLKNRCDNPDDSLHGIKIKCEQNDSGTCKGACGWSFPGGDTIHICPQQWSNPGSGDPGCTLMHELTHMSGRFGEKWPQNVENCLGCR